MVSECIMGRKGRYFIILHCHERTRRIMSTDIVSLVVSKIKNNGSMDKVSKKTFYEEERTA